MVNSGFQSPELESDNLNLMNPNDDPIIGEWKLVIQGQTDENGDHLSEEIQQSQREMREAFGLAGSEDDRFESDSVDYEERLTFNTSGEYFSTSSGYGGIYLKTDSTLKISSSEYKILTLNDSILTIVEKPDDIQILDVFAYRSYRRINRTDVTSSRTQMKQLILGNWTGEHAQQVTVEGHIYFNERVNISDTTSERTINNLNIKAGQNEMKFETKEGVLAGTYQYDIADSLILAEHTPAFIILEITPTGLTLLGPHDNRTQSTLILTFRKTEM